jgi:hypothetical protein
MTWMKAQGLMDENIADIDNIPRKATNNDFSLAMNTNSCVAQACNSLLFRAFAPCS